MYQRILVANRGEIALRIIRACRELGIETVAIFSEADRGAQYLRSGRRGVLRRPGQGGRQLSQDRQRDQRRRSRQRAGDSSRATASSPRTPTSTKSAAAATSTSSAPRPRRWPSWATRTRPASWPARPSVPVVPGSEGLDRQTSKRRCGFAHEIGFPVLIKAIGRRRRPRHARGRRTTWRSRSALQQARAEAEAAFGNGGVYLEKYIEQPRHVEVQVLADHHGNVVHLWERDCIDAAAASEADRRKPQHRASRPRRAPAMCDAAVRLIQAADYTNAGTVEFIVDQQRQLLLHRSQRPHPGRAPGDRDGHRHRPDQVADSHRRRRAAAVHAGRHRRSAARRSSAASTPKIRSATSSRRPARSSS